ncbi:molybdate ABC transporter permease subunit [Sneathiella glossodoripedis]|uniref:molybdate ABC transporter permease subunit n=1 Tax=Sneathiella glossodoripedis TaxID=418853 RepID=UPI00046EFDDB|nr:molybdate ABC transporter permease subunit [Sneathiella glossodoripedis]
MSLSAEEWEVIYLSLKIALWCITISALPALFIAWLLARCQFKGKTLLSAIVHLPLVIPPVVTGYFLLVLLGRNGPIGRWLHEAFEISLIFSWHGAVIATAVMSFPLMVRALRSGFETHDWRLNEVAATLGKGPVRRFLTITAPLLIPSFISAITLGFARALGEFGATITFVSNIPGETRNLPIAIYGLLQIPGGDDKVIRLVIISVLISFAAIALSEWLVRKRPTREGT